MISVSGDRQLFSRLAPGLEGGLPSEEVEWKRSFGRSSKIVKLDAKFLPLEADRLTYGGLTNPRKLKGQPILHTYWTECPDIDTYKSQTKDEISHWLGTLRKCGVASDWMVILIESPDFSKKVANKLLPRTSVLDKLKADLANKQPERCISVIDPSKSDSRGSESWQTLLQRLRSLLLQSYNRTLVR